MTEKAFENMEMTCLYCDRNLTSLSHFNDHVCNDDSRPSISADRPNQSEKAHTLHLEEPAPAATGEEGDMEMACLYCEEKFRSQASLTKHKCSLGADNDCAWEKGLYSQQGFEACCLYCGKGFSTQCQLDNHECSTGNQPPLRDVNQNLDEILDRPEARDREPQIEIACLDCAKKFPCQIDLNGHECSAFENHPVPDKFVCTDRLVRSEALDELVVEVACLYCSEKFTNPDQLNDHRCALKEKDHQPRAQLEIEKTSCQAALNDDSGEKWQTADDPPDSTATKNEFMSFVESRPFMCSICNKRFKRTDHLKRHKQAVHSEDTYSCFHCDKAFKTLANLRSHERIHLKQMPFKCNVCNKGYKNLSSLRSHEKAHSEPEDGKRYITVNGLKVKGFKGLKGLKVKSVDGHLTIVHADDGPLKCTLCDISSTANADLRRHFVGQSYQHPNSTERIFRCSFCEQSFSHPSPRNDHEKTHLEQLQPTTEDEISVSDQDVEDENTGLVSEIKTETTNIEDSSEG